MTRLRMGKSIHRWEVVNPAFVRLRISTPFCLVPGRFAPNPVCPLSRFAPIPVRPRSFRPYSCSPQVASPSFINSPLNQRLPGACNRSPGSKLLSITTQLHCGGQPLNQICVWWSRPLTKMAAQLYLV
jgi:hypothetical protein